MDPIARQLVTRLRQDPRDEAAYEALKAHYYQSGDFASLANLLEGWAGQHEHAPQAAAQAYVDSARAVVQAGGDPGRARLLYEHALRLQLLHPEAARELLAVLEQAGDPQALFDMLDRYSQALEQAQAAPALIASVYARIGQLCEEAYGQPDVAAQYYDRARELEQGLVQPATALEAPVAATPVGAPVPAHEPAHLPAPEAAATIAALESELAQAQTLEQRMELHCALARAYRDEQLDVESAIAVLRRALSESPGDVQVMHELAGSLLARAEHATPEAAQADHYRVAELFYQIAQGIDEAQAFTYLESALDAMPAHEGALSLLERLAQQQGLTARLPARWVAYVALAKETPEADARRLALAEAYVKARQLSDAADCLRPLAERGNARAHELLQQVYALEGAPSGEPPSEELPRTRKRRSTADERALAAARIAELRKQLHEQIASRKHEESAQTCEQILALDANDPEAFNLLESHFRKRREHARLRDLLLSSTRSPGLSVDARKVRLREVATLSESKLRDAEGAISAYRGVVTLDPSDRDAVRNLKRLLKKAESWDELAAVLEREALATADLQEKASLIHEIALLHRDKRGDRVETAEALRQLHGLRPDDAAVRDELIALSLELGQHEDAARLLRERVQAAPDDREKVKSLQQLAQLLQDEIKDPEAAFSACEEILALRTSDKTSFDLMERIDEGLGNHERLLRTLERRSVHALRADRPALLVRMASLAQEQLGDLDKATELLSEALDITPDDKTLLDRLVAVFEGAHRFEDLAELLRERAVIEKDKSARARLHRKLGEVLAARLHDEDGAVEAYTLLLTLEPDRPALEYLCERARAHGDHARLCELLERLAALADEPGERRALDHERARLLRDELDRRPEALDLLARMVDADEGFEAGVQDLVELAEELEQSTVLARALELQLALTTGEEERTARAKRLAELCASLPEPDQSERMIRALLAWAGASTRDPEPHRRLRPLLQRAERYAELVESLDALSTWEDSLQARDVAQIEAAQIAFEHLQDIESAWKRLLPLTQEGNADAESLLLRVGRAGDRMPAIAALYVKLAQAATDGSDPIAYWQKAADVLEHDLQQLDQALEAALRMLAADMQSASSLARVDSLARATRAWKRLAQVYDRLLRQTESDATKAALLAQHANALEDDEPDEALDRLLRACSLAPDDEALLARTEALAKARKRSEDLLVVYDRKRARATSDGERIEALLRATHLCDVGLLDRERSLGYLKQALTAANTTELREQVQAAARTMDVARPDLGLESARRALVRLHRELAEKAPAEVASSLIQRAAALLIEELHDERAAFDILRQGVSLAPLDEAVYEAFLTLATNLKRLDAVDAHLSRLIDETIDSNVTVALLRRRGHLLEGPLDRPKDTAQVYTKLLQLRPADTEAAEKLRASLRAAGRFQDLLVALDRQLQRTSDAQARLSLLKEIAQTWERDLKNRWEASDAWKAVQAQDGADEEAKAALERLGKLRGSSPGSVAAIAASVAEVASTAPADDQPLEASTAQALPSDDARAEDSDEATALAAAVVEGAVVQGADEPALADTALGALDSDSAAADDTASAAEPEAFEQAPLDATPLDATPLDASEEADLDALDAELARRGGGVEGIDTLDDAVVGGDGAAIDIEEDFGAMARPAPPPAPPPPRKSAPPPLPTARRSAPPPLPNAQRASMPLPPGGPESQRSSAPPPLPEKRGSQRMSAPPSLPVRPERERTSTPPPLPRKR